MSELKQALELMSSYTQHTTIETSMPNKMTKLLEKIMKDLYALEDLNDYKNNNIGRAINLLQGIKFKDVSR